MTKLRPWILACSAWLLITGTATGQVAPLAMDQGPDARARSLLDRPAHLLLHDATLLAALTRLSETSGSPVAFSPSLLAREPKRIDCACEDVTVRHALEQILEGTPFHYRELSGEILVLRERRATGRDVPHTVQPNQPSRALPALASRRQTPTRQGTVTGRVTATATQQPLAGALIRIPGESLGAVTDADGYFSIENVPARQVEVRVQLIGYIAVSQSVEVRAGETANVLFELEADPLALDELIVTAFGIERESRRLSYAVQEVQGVSVSRMGNTDVLSGLQGKVAGVTVRQASGVPGVRPQITIRGSRSFTGGNEPLYVIDGMPIDGSRPIDLHPGDIESLNVLKGPTAAALYGLRASNGAIIITTRRAGGVADGPVITYDANFSLDRLSVWPEVQQTYMQGSPAGGYEPNSAFSWGPRIDEMGEYTNQMGQQVQARAYDNVRAFFQTGHTWNNNVNISQRLENGAYSLSLGSTNQTGIVPTSSYERINIKADGDYSPTERWSVSTSLNYTKGDRDSFFYSGGGNSNVFYAAFWAPVSYDLAGFPTHVEGDPFTQINFRGQHDNIYWLLDNDREELERDRFFGNLHSSYQLADWAALSYRIGLDTYNESGKTVLALGSGATGGRTNPPSGGSIADRLYVYQQLNSNLSMQLSRSLRDDLEVDLLLGSEINDIRSRTVSASGSGIIIGGFNHISNTTVTTSGESLGRNRVVGLFGDLSVAWRNALYLSLTGRNDVVSNMPRGNRRFFYPSAGLGVVLTELLDVRPSVLPFAKLRASIAEVGQAGPNFSTQNVFVPGGGGGFGFPFAGVRGFTLSGNMNSSDLEPENTRTLEFGLDLRFVDGRMGLDYTYYNTTSKGQIFRVPVPVSTGFSTELRNAGEMSTKGHELVLSASPLRGPLGWDLIANFTTFDNRVISLAEGITELGLGGSYVSIVAEVGEPYPIVKGPGYARDPNTGQVVVDSRETLPNGQPNPYHGFPLRATGNVNLGKVYPDFELGISNAFTFRRFGLNAQIDWRRGGNISSGTNRLGDLYGASAKTEWREDDYVWPGKKGYYEGDGTLVVVDDNDVVIRRGFDYHQYIDPIRESIVYDASYVRLREVTLSYDLPPNPFGWSLFSDASVFVGGRNLLLHSKLPNADPEMNWRTESGNFQGEENLTYPLSKSLVTGFRVRF